MADLRLHAGHGVVVIVSLLTALFLPAATGAESKHAKLVRDLSWDSVHGECSGLVWRIEPRGRAVTRLLKIGRPATGDLLHALLDPDRAVAAQLVLCRIWAREDACATSSIGTTEPPPELKVGEQFDINSIRPLGDDRYASGALEWQSDVGGRYSVVASTLEPNLGWWCNYLPEDTLRLTSACSGRRARLRSELGQSGDGCAPVAADAQRWTDRVEE